MYRPHRLSPVLLACALACAGDDEERRPRDPAAASLPTAFADSLPVCDDAVAIEVDTVARGLVVPWDLAFLPDGRVLVTERGGAIRVVRDGRLEPEPWAVLDVYAAGEAGLLGIDVAPDFATTGHVFVATTSLLDRSIVTRVVDRVRRLAGRPAHAVVTRVVRLTDEAGRGTAPTVVADGIPGGQIHAGGALRFGPDGRLHLGTGEAGVPSLAGDPTLRAGAIVVVPDGDVVASGFRNVQGMDWSPADGGHWAIDHGPTGMLLEQRRHGLDELNVVERGGDYGWPVEMGRVAIPTFRPPRLLWPDAIAPAGMAFWRDGGPWQGDLFIAGLAARDLIRVRLDATAAPSCTRRLFGGTYGRMRAVRMGPDGWLWLSTSNQDGRGAPAPADDLLLRLRPAPRK